MQSAIIYVYHIYTFRLYALLHIYIYYYIYTESWTWSPMLPQLHASVLPPAQPWTCKHCHTKRALAHPTYSYWFILIPIPIQNPMRAPNIQNVSQHVSQNVSQCKGSWANRFSVLWGFFHRVWLQPVQQIELSQVQAGCSKFVAPLNFGLSRSN